MSTQTFFPLLDRREAAIRVGETRTQTQHRLVRPAAVLVATPNKDTEGLLRQYLLSTGLLIVNCVNELSELPQSPAGARDASVLLVDHAFVRNKRGVRIISRICRAAQELQILVFGGNPDNRDKRRYLEAGAHGHVTLSGDGSQLVQAIEEVAAGGLWFERRVLVEVLRRGRPASVRASTEAGDRPVSEILTPREEIVAWHACQGLRNREIAERLHISEKTVKIHLSRVYKKLGLSNRVQLGLSLGAASAAARV